MTPSVRAADRCSTTRPYLHIQRNAHGKPIGHPDHASFFAAAVENDLAAFVPALHPGADRVIGPPLLQALIAFPNENGFAVAP
jgi:aminocarboxymuconate-semialdehyde decarboxylase